MTFPGNMIVQSGFDPAEDHIGPFYYAPKESSEVGVYGFKLKDHHCNAMGVVDLALSVRIGLRRLKTSLRRKR